MAGNSERQGAVRKTGSKKGPQVGTGGHSRRALRGKGPTPKATDREYHPAYKRKEAAEKRAASSPGGQPQSRSGGTGGRGPTHKNRRRGDATEIIAGRNAVLEALRAHMPVSCVYIASRLDADDRTEEILELAAARSLKFVEGSKLELDRLTDNSVHQGIAIQVPPYEYVQAEDLLDAAASSGLPPLIVALDGVTDPHNLGAVLRSAGAFGAHGILVPERRAAGMTASAWKVSAGAGARVPVARATNLTRELEALKKAGCFVVGLDAGGDAEMSEIAYATDPLVLVIGSEGKGLSRLVRETCDTVASIPIAATTESLNAAVAAGIALYEVAKQRRQG